MKATTHSQAVEAAVESLMTLAQEFASGWSLVGGPFDGGSAIDNAEEAKEGLRNALRAELARPQAASSSSEAADARREIGKWLNEGTDKPVDRLALAQLCAGFDALTRPQEVAAVGGIKRWTHYEDDFDHFEDPDGDWVTYADHVASHVQEVAAAGPMTSIDDMCAILKRRRINASEYTDCTILYQVTFEQLRAIYDEGRATSRAQEVVRAEPVAVIGDTFSLFWVGSKPIAELARKHNLKVGDKLYTVPPSTAPAQPKDPAPGPVAVGQLCEEVFGQIVWFAKPANGSLLYSTTPGGAGGSVVAGLSEQDAEDADMVMLLRRFILTARRHCEDGSPVLTAANNAWKYLHDKDLLGSPLRDAAIIASEPTVGEVGP